MQFERVKRLMKGNIIFISKKIHSFIELELKKKDGYFIIKENGSIKPKLKTSILLQEWGKFRVYACWASSSCEERVADALMISMACCSSIRRRHAFIQSRERARGHCESDKRARTEPSRSSFNR